MSNIVTGYSGVTPKRSLSPDNFNSAMETFFPWLEGLPGDINNAITAMAGLVNAETYSATATYNPTDYTIPSVVFDDGALWICLGDNVTGDRPSTSSTGNWRRYVIGGNVALPDGVEMTGTVVGGRYTVNATTATIIDLPAGAMKNSDNTAPIKWAALSKDGNAAWLPGDGNGMNLTASALVADRCYLLLSLLPDGGGDADMGCIEMSETISLNLPTGYGKYGFLGLLFTDGAGDFYKIFWVDDDTFEFKTAGGLLLESASISTTPHIPAYSSILDTSRVSSVGLWGKGIGENLMVVAYPDGVTAEYNLINVLTGGYTGNYTLLNNIPLDLKIAATETARDSGNIYIKRIKLRR